MKRLQRASTEWGGLILFLLNRSTLTTQELGLFIDAADGTIVFEWERGGSELDRTMFVTQFRGVLSRLEDDDIVQFETEVTESGFDISDVRQIR
jgi:KaiC/GvpD/RAD55 family RecA-like ATPase